MGIRLHLLGMSVNGYPEVDSTLYTRTLTGTKFAKNTLSIEPFYVVFLANE